MKAMDLSIKAIVAVLIALILGMLYLKYWPSSSESGNASTSAILIYDISEWTPAPGILLDKDDITWVIEESRLAATRASASGYTVVRSEFIMAAPQSAYLVPGMFGSDKALKMLQGLGDD